MDHGVAGFRTQGIFKVVQRNVNRTRVRLGLEQARARAGLDEDIRDQEGNIVQDQSDDGVIPQVPRETLLAQSSLPTLEPTRNTERGGNTEGTCPNPKTSGAAESDLEDLAFRMRYTAGPPDAKTVVSVAPGRLHRADQGPNRGWPAYELMFPMGDPASAVRGPIFASKNYRNLDAKHGWVTGDPMGPSSMALTLAGAVRDDVAAFRTLGANLGLIRPLVNRDFQVWDMPGRKARAGKERHDWRKGVRLGPTASGEWSQRIHDLCATPPGI